MTSVIRSFTEISVLLFALTVSSARADVLGSAGPLVPGPYGSFQVYRTDQDDALLPDVGDDASCVKNLPRNLRELFFEHFRYYSDHSNAQMGETEIARFAKVLGMVTRESGGASAAVTDMHYHGSKESSHHFYATDNPGRSAPQALYSSTATLHDLIALKNVSWNSQTNFGLLQMSADRLAVSGSKGAYARDMITNLKKLFLSHPDEVINRCGTELMFKDSNSDIRQAFRGIQSCQPGIKTRKEVKCFGLWATLCPNYNVAVALITSPAYFATRRSPPVCAKTFRKILYRDRSKEVTAFGTSESLPPTINEFGS